MSQFLNDNDVHVTIRVSAKAHRKADQITVKANRENLKVQGPVNPIRIRSSHILRLAVEKGLPLVLDELRDMQGQLKTEE